MTTAVDSRRFRWSVRCAHALASMLALAVVPGVQAQEAEDPEPSTAEPGGATATPLDSEATEPPPWKNRFGVRVDAGAPDGVGVSALAYPRRWLRAHAGMARNSLGYGVRGGVSLIPLELFVSPTLDIDVGHYFNADYDQLLTRLRGQPTTTATGIRGVGYDFASASLGLELSPSRHVTLFGGVGLSYWSIQVDEVEAFIREAESNPEITAKPLSIRLTSPAVKLGVLIYFH